MTRAFHRGPHDYQKCHACGVRYWQDKNTRMCNRCWKEFQAQQALDIAAHANKRDRAETIARVEAILHPPPFAVAIYGGVEFWVIWDGQFRYETPKAAVERFNAGAPDAA